jgi:hypothetical protein
VIAKHNCHLIDAGTDVVGGIRAPVELEVGGIKRFEGNKKWIGDSPQHKVIGQFIGDFGE